MSERLVAGIDGGQSSTVAVIVDESGVVRGRGVAGPSDHVDEAADSRRCAIACERAVERARDAAGIDAATMLDAVVVGLSGYDGALHGAAPQLHTARLRFDHDAPVALAGAVVERPAIVVIAGTGSVAYGETAEGRTFRVGGFGFLFGDGGSAFALARAALASAMAQDDRRERTRLGEAALAFFDCSTLRDLARAVYVRDIGRPQLASFARVVYDAARLGDAEARALVDEAASALGSLAATAVERMGDTHGVVSVAFVGGAVENADYLMRVSAHLASLAPSARIVAPRYEPAIGAALLAFDDAGIVRPAEVVTPAVA